jgi:HD-GYP domain-containing protein (c-di-GMP phosphodiesterase class II)
MRAHPVVGAALIAESPLGPEIASIVLSHHERPDGTGYPDGMAAERIPIGSRIIHICEAFDAMTSTDSYQPPVQPNAAVGKIRRSAGTQFDAELTAKFAEMLGLG